MVLGLNVLPTICEFPDQFPVSPSTTVPKLMIELPEQTSEKLTGVKTVFGITTTCVVLGLKHEPDPLGVNVTVKVPAPEAEILKILPVRNGLPDHTPLIPPC